MPQTFRAFDRELSINAVTSQKKWKISYIFKIYKGNIILHKNNKKKQKQKCCGNGTRFSYSDRTHLRGAVLRGRHRAKRTPECRISDRLFNTPVDLRPP